MSLNVKRVNLKFLESFSVGDRVSDPSSYSEIRSKPQGKWAAKEGLPLPLGASWVEDEQAFNFAVYAEHAGSVTLFLYSAQDLVDPILTFQFDSLRNKSGHIWHCRIPLNQMCDAQYYGYSVSKQAVAGPTNFDYEKVLLDPYAKGVFFPREFDRKLAIAPGRNAGRAPLGILSAYEFPYDWEGPPGLNRMRSFTNFTSKGLRRTSIQPWIRPWPAPTPD